MVFVVPAFLCLELLLFIPSRVFSHPFSAFIFSECTISVLSLFVHNRLCICLIHPLKLSLQMFWHIGGSQSNDIHWIHLDFPSGYHLHLMPPEPVTKILLVNLSVHDPVPCSIQFYHIFISFLLLQFSRSSHSSGMVFQSSVLILSPTNLFKIFLRCIKFINGCTKQGPCLRNSIVTSPQSNSFLSRSTLLFPFSPHLIPISSSFNNYHSVSLEHFTEAQRKTSKVLHLSKVYQRKGWVNLWSFIFIAFTHFPFTLNLLFENCFAKSFMKSTFFFFFFPPKKFSFTEVYMESSFCICLAANCFFHFLLFVFASLVQWGPKHIHPQVTSPQADPTNKSSCYTNKKRHLPYWNTGFSTKQDACISSCLLHLLFCLAQKKWEEVGIKGWRSRKSFYPPQCARLK